MDEIEAQLRRVFTPDDAIKLMWDDYRDDPTVVRLEDKGKMIMGMMKEGQDGFYCEAGDMTHDEPLFGVRHDYQQARVCLAWMKEFDTMIRQVALTPEVISTTNMMVPDIPPYDPKIVDSNAGERKFEAPLVRQDYHRIMRMLKLAAPPAGVVVDDAVMTGIYDPPRQGNQPIFLGRSQAPLSNAVYLRFNPLTSAGAALVKHVVKADDRLYGQYEVRGKLYDFNYEFYNATDKGRYTVSPDDWVPRLSVESFDLLAFDMVGDYDFWPYGAEVYNPTPVPGRTVPVRDRIVPLGYRFVDYDPGRACYHQRTLDAASGKEAEYIMHHGSSRVHRVQAVQVEEKEGLYVRLEMANESVLKPIILYEMKYEGKPTGIFVSQEPDNLLEPEKWSVGREMRLRYAEGPRNAIRIDAGAYSAYVFRAKNLGAARPGRCDQLMIKHDVPLCGILTNPASSHVLLSGKYFSLTTGEKRFAFTTHFMHAGVYNSIRESVAFKGVDLFQYTIATHTAARLRVLFDLRGDEIWEDTLIVDATADTIGNVTSERPETQLDRIYAELCDKMYGD